MTRGKQAIYQITIRGALDPNWSVWLNGFEFHTELSPDGTSITTLTGSIIDQAALRGLLNKMWDLNLELVSLNQRTDPGNSDLSNRPVQKGR